MSAFARVSDLDPLPIWEGVLGRAVQGAHITLALVELAPDSVVPEHRHHNEQLGLVLNGEMTLTVGGERRTLHAGDTYVIPANVPHDAVAGGQGAAVIDVFSPVRDDWSRFTPIAPRPARWP